VINAGFLLHQTAVMLSESLQGRRAWSQSVPKALYLLTGVALMLVSVSSAMRPGAHVCSHHVQRTMCCRLTLHA